MISLFLTLLAAATTQPPLAPSGKWTVDYQKDMCLVTRPFGPAGASTIFAIKPAISMEGGGQTLFVLASNVGGKGVRRGQATVMLQPSGVQRKIGYVSWIPKGTEFRGYEIDADADLVTAIGEATGLGVTAGKDSFSFATGKMQPVFKALTACNENLFRSWGVDPAARAHPLGNPAYWFPADSYPSDAKRRGVSGRSVVVITVSAEGRSAACRVAVKADPVLDDKTCELAMRNGRFEPAPGKSDRYAILAVRWALWDF
jgi:TonB family protein